MTIGNSLYKAVRWDKSRKVKMKLEKPIDPLLFIPTFIVTTLDEAPEATIECYAKR